MSLTQGGTRVWSVALPAHRPLTLAACEAFIAVGLHDGHLLVWPCPCTCVRTHLQIMESAAVSTGPALPTACAQAAPDHQLQPPLDTSAERCCLLR